MKVKQTEIWNSLNLTEEVKLKLKIIKKKRFSKNTGRE